MGKSPCVYLPAEIGLILHRFSSGGWITLVAAVLGQMGGIDDIGRRIGAIHTVSGVGAVCGPPISGLFATSSLGYTAVGYLAGAWMPVLLHLRTTAPANAKLQEVLCWSGVP
jgi:MCP family monocarboxylic acid transporter-like MFS transporter 10